MTKEAGRSEDQAARELRVKGEPHGQTRRVLGTDPNLEYDVEQRGSAPNDPYYSSRTLSQWHLWGPASSPSNPFGSNAAGAWPTTTGSSAV